MFRGDLRPLVIIHYLFLFLPARAESDRESSKEQDRYLSLLFRIVIDIRSSEKRFSFEIE